MLCPLLPTSSRGRSKDGAESFRCVRELPTAGPARGGARAHHPAGQGRVEVHPVGQGPVRLDPVPAQPGGHHAPAALLDEAGEAGQLGLNLLAQQQLCQQKHRGIYDAAPSCNTYRLVIQHM